MPPNADSMRIKMHDIRNRSPVARNLFSQNSHAKIRKEILFTAHTGLTHCNERSTPRSGTRQIAALSVPCRKRTGIRCHRRCVHRFRNSYFSKMSGEQKLKYIGTMSYYCHLLELERVVFEIVLCVGGI